MEVDHRQPYPGDHGIGFEPVDDTAITRGRVANLRWRKCGDGIGELQRRVAAVLEYIPFGGKTERQLFGLAVQQAISFEDLPEQARGLIRAGECAKERKQEEEKGQKRSQDLLR
jgi:hypothetical protein